MVSNRRIRGMKVLDQVQGNNYTLYQGDSCEVLAGIPENSIHYSVTSIPFASLYTYSNSDRDLGNSRNYAEFAEHYSFLGKEWFRIMMPGRLVSIHCMNLPSMKERDGVIGLKDFRGDVIRWMQSCGFIFHSEVCIWKNPVTEMQRTKALGLLHKQIKKDSAMSRMGIPDYVVTFRKPGENPEPVEHTNETYPVGHWQEVASPVWEEYPSPVWWDINQSNTLQRKSARTDKDERHICFAEGTLVLTKRGYIPIEDVIVGQDETLTHTGAWKLIIGKSKTQCDAPVIQTRAIGVPHLISTPNHKLFAKHPAQQKDRKAAVDKARPEWIEAQNAEGCYLGSILPPEQDSDISAQEWWIIGRWLADGHRDVRDKQFFVSIAKSKYEAFEEHAVGHIGHVSNHEGVYQVGLINMSESARKVLFACGKGAKNKVVPFEAMSLNSSLAKSFVDGYLSGDGFFGHDKKICATSISRALLLGIAICLKRAYGLSSAVYQGRGPRKKMIQGREVTCTTEWNLVASHSYSFNYDDGTYEWKKVRKSIPAGTADVWSIEVDGDHSYTAEGCIVKNCPLQLSVIDRCIELWSNPGDVVLDPFDGIGSVGYEAIKMGRRHVGVELKRSYFEQAALNLANAENEANKEGQLTLEEAANSSEVV